MKHLTAPCAACPYSRKVAPGALGGSSPLTYIGQAEGPFMLPCHKTCDFEDPEWKCKIETDAKQCAGAAIYRANIRVDHKMPGGLLKLPANCVDVFSSHAEFLAHHRNISVEQAQKFLNEVTPETLMLMEISNANVRFIK